MTEKYDSKFHKQYVSGEGEVEEKPMVILKSENKLSKEKTEDVLAWYREYIGDAKAELPVEVLKSFVALGKITDENGEN